MFWALMMGFTFLLGMVAVNFINHRFTEKIPVYLLVYSGIWSFCGLVYLFTS